jgi:hypothetical protein
MFQTFHASNRSLLLHDIRIEAKMDHLCMRVGSILPIMGRSLPRVYGLRMGFLRDALFTPHMCRRVIHRGSV